MLLASPGLVVVAVVPGLSGGGRGQGGPVHGGHSPGQPEPEEDVDRVAAGDVTDGVVRVRLGGGLRVHVCVHVSMRVSVYMHICVYRLGVWPACVYVHVCVHVACACACACVHAACA